MPMWPEEEKTQPWASQATEISGEASWNMSAVRQSTILRWKPRA